MPGEGHVFDPLLAVIPDQRERQSIFGAATETIFGRAFASFGRVTSGFLNCNGIPGDGDIAPNVALSIDDIERVISFHGPDGAERVGPGANERGLSRARICGAGIEQYKKNADENDLKRALDFHAGHLERSAEIDSSTF